MSPKDHDNIGATPTEVQPQFEPGELEKTELPAEEQTHLRSAKSVFRLGLLMLVVFGFILFLGYIPRLRNAKVTASEADRQKNQAPLVEVTPAMRSTATTQLSLPGSSSALVEAPIYARASGYIAKRFVDIGDRVKAGQFLAIVDAPDLDQQVDQARANQQQSESVLRQTEAQAKLARVTWDRYKVLVERGVLSRQDGDTQEAAYDVATANVLAAKETVNANQANLQRLLKLQGYERVTAPFAGVVTARNIDVGSLISVSGSGMGANNTANTALSYNGTGAQGGEMFRIARLDHLRIFVSVPESSAEFVAVGQTVNLHFDAVRGQDFAGKVVRTANAIDPNTRTLLTEVQVENKNGALLPGTYVTVTFNNIRSAPPIIVPGDTVITRSTGTMVAVVRNNVVHLQPVTLGRDYGAQTEIREGLQEGDLVIVNPGDTAREGAQVNARLLPKPQSPPNPATPASGTSGNANSGQAR